MEAALKGSERTQFNNSSIRQIREDGYLPAVVYGQKKESRPIFVNSADFLKLMRENGRNGIFNLTVNDQKYPVMLTDLQKDSLKGTLLHADFQIIDLSSEVEVEVNVNLVGEAQGVKDGGVLQQPFHHLSIRALPDEIPQSIDLDITGLEVGQALTIGDIQTGGRYTINHDPSEAVVSILPPRQEKEIDSGEQQEEGQPESQEGRETPAE